MINNKVGDLSPLEAWEILSNDPKASLVDVRTMPEWSFVGYPNLSMLGKEVIKLSWRLYPTMQINNKFIEQLSERVSDKTSPLLFLCRTGGRSLDAAIVAASSGFATCYNVADGFEGELDNNKKRGNVSGWKSLNLPWEQD
jgi:rhodanese-related sulfurtransferase